MVIITQYLAPTTNKGARVQAKNDLGEKIVIYWDHSISAFLNHQEAIKQLIANLDYCNGNAVVSQHEKGLIAIIGGFKL
jgi:hypothetical protein